MFIWVEGNVKQQLSKLESGARDKTCLLHLDQFINYSNIAVVLGQEVLITHCFSNAGQVLQICKRTHLVIHNI